MEEKPKKKYGRQPDKAYRDVRPPLAPDEILPYPLPGETGQLSDRFNLTKEQFLFLAENRPEITVKSIYQLQVYKIPSKFDGYSPKYPEKYERKNNDGNWTLPIQNIGTGYFSTFEEAETALHRCHITHPIHSAIIRRLPIDRYFGAEWLQWWLYDSKGMLIDRSVSTPFFDQQPEYISGRYMGRKEESLRFRKEDIVEVIDDRNPGQVYLGIVKALPETPEQMWINLGLERTADTPALPKSSEEDFYYLDANHDKYFIRDLGSKRMRAEAPYKVFAPSLTIPEELKKHSENYHKRG